MGLGLKYESGRVSDSFSSSFLKVRFKKEPRPSPTVTLPRFFPRTSCPTGTVGRFLPSTIPPSTPSTSSQCRPPPDHLLSPRLGPLLPSPLSAATRLQPLGSLLSRPSSLSYSLFPSPSFLPYLRGQEAPSICHAPSLLPLLFPVLSLPSSSLSAKASFRRRSPAPSPFSARCSLPLSLHGQEAHLVRRLPSLHRPSFAPLCRGEPLLSSPPSSLFLPLMIALLLPTLLASSPPSCLPLLLSAPSSLPSFPWFILFQLCIV